MAIFPIRQDRIALAILLGIAFIGVPLLATFHIWPFGSDYLLRAILLPFLILALAAIGVNILVGYCGQISLGSGAFMAIGAYSAYKLGTGVHIPLAWLGFAISIPPLPVLSSILLGGLTAAVAGILFGVPSLRIKGLYLAVATLAAQFFFDWVFLRVSWFTNYAPSGSVNAPTLNFFGLVLDTPIERYLLCLTFVTVFAVLAKNLVRGNLGRQWMAIRDMDIAAELIGIRPLNAKLTAFAFSIDRSLQLLFMVIIGGLGSIVGSFVGAAFILILPIILNLIPTQLGVPLSTETITHLEFIIFGSLICYLLIKEPHGFARLISLGKEKLRLWPFPY